MSKKMLIDATHAEETRVVVADGNKIEEFDFETIHKRQLAGNIYLAKVTRVEPSLQAAFVDYGGNRHGFLAFSEIHPDYYQIPVADREKLLEEEAEYAAAMEDEEARRAEKSKSRRRRRKPKTEAAAAENDAVVTSDVVEPDVIDIDEDDNGLVDVPENKEPKAEEPSLEEAEAPAVEEKPKRRRGRPRKKPVEEEVVEASAEDAVETKAEDASETPDIAAETEAKADVAKSEEPAQDADIESVADDDVEEEIRVRKPRPRRYKIQEVVKVRQIMLVQVVKEERGNKGAALTTYLSLAGRYCVLMPNTARGGGISRKITNAVDRKKIKEITNSIEVPKGAGLIVRTAGAKRNKTDIKRDYEYLLRQWEQIRDLTLDSIAPAQIYAEGDLIKRSIRDLYNRDIDEILIEGERGFTAARDYMSMLMPTHVNKVQLYNDPMPLFSRYQVENYLAGMFNPTVQLKSGGYIVIGITEALVAVDVNSGRATKEGSIEETALRTNLEASDEVARQMRLRDLAGLIVIDYIDMEERRNNNAVEKRLKDRLKNDRARIQVGRISGFGLLEMSRQRLRPGMLEATTAPCPHCHGTGLLRSDNSQALSILREIEEEATKRRSKEVLIKAPVGIANYLLNEKREHISDIEARFGLSVRVEGDLALISPDYQIERFKTATRIVVQAADTGAAVTMDSTQFDDTLSEADDEGQNNAPAADGDDEQPKKKRRRRKRGGRGRNRNRDEQNGALEGADENLTESSEASENSSEDAGAETVAAEPVTSDEVVEEKPAKKPRRSRKKAEPKAEEAVEDAVVEQAEAPEQDAEEKPKPKRTRRKKAEPKAEEAEAEVVEAPAEAEAEVKEKPKRARRKKAEPKVEEVATAAEPVTEPEPVATEATPEPKKADKPKRRGWWSRG